MAGRSGDGIARYNFFDDDDVLYMFYYNVYVCSPITMFMASLLFHLILLLPYHRQSSRRVELNRAGEKALQAI